MSEPNGSYYEVYSYKLRSSGAVPIGPGRFLAQAFGVDKNKVRTYEASTGLPDTADFTGANVSGRFISANFQRMPYITSAGQQVFQGTTVARTEFVDESQMPGGAGRGW
jgi:hypothetical protein